MLSSFRGSVSGEAFGTVAAVAAFASGNENAGGAALDGFVVGGAAYALAYEGFFDCVILGRHINLSRLEIETLTS
jgi:hypothetical protein